MKKILWILANILIVTGLFSWAVDPPNFTSDLWESGQKMFVRLYDAYVKESIRDENNRWKIGIDSDGHSYIQIDYIKYNGIDPDTITVGKDGIMVMRSNPLSITQGYNDAFYNVLLLKPENMIGKKITVNVGANESWYVLPGDPMIQ